MLILSSGQEESQHVRPISSTEPEREKEKEKRRKVPLSSCRILKTLKLPPFLERKRNEKKKKEGIEESKELISPPVD